MEKNLAVGLGGVLASNVRMALRDRARKEWGAGFSLRRFHAAMLELGSPPLGLLGTAVDRG